MSEMAIWTNETRPSICAVCAADVKQQKTTGVNGAINWITVQHDALCGAPCSGGRLMPADVSAMMLPTMKHWTEAVHGWKADDARCCPNGCKTFGPVDGTGAALVAACDKVRNDLKAHGMSITAADWKRHLGRDDEDE